MSTPFKTFRRRPINTDKRGIPMLIQQGIHSLSPEMREQFSTKGQPAGYVSQGKHSKPNKNIKEDANDEWRAYQQQQMFKSKQENAAGWNPEFNFNTSTYAPQPLGTAAQQGLERYLSRLSPEGLVGDSLNEKYKLDNHHLVPTVSPQATAYNHISNHADVLQNQYGGDRGSLHDQIYKYTEDSTWLNGHLWDSFLDGKTPQTYINGHDIPELDAALGSKQLQQPLTVFSGVKMNPGLMAAKNAYNRIFFPAYTSTSINPQTALGFALNLRRGTEREQQFGDKSSDKHILRIHLPAGHPGEYIGHRSHFDNEQEFLLPRETSMEVNPNPSIVKVRNPYRGRVSVMHVHVWDAHPIRP